MKTTLCFILTFFTFVTFTFSPNSFAQDLRPMVRLIYFLPKDRQPQKDIDTKMDVLVKEVQRVYADEMERHGFGRKTFQIETDATGKAVLYRVNGQFADAYYQKNWNRVGDEISKKFDLSKNVYVASMETNSKSLCGLGAAHSSMGGSILIPSSGLCMGIGATTHELGHVFGLDHDFRNNLYHMSYGADWEKNQFSQCAAEWLNAHRAFNPAQTAVDEPSTIKMLRPSIEFSSNAIRLRFEVTDADGLYQAQLKSDTTDEDPAPGSPKLIDCKSLSGESGIVEFVTTLLTPKNKLVYLAVMDVHGNFIRNQFPINVPVQRGPSSVVPIPDAKLVVAIQEALGLAPNDPITTHAMSVLDVLSAPNRQITDLTGLEYAPKLTVLNLEGNSILDISTLSGLTQLTNLLISDNGISDVSPLEKLVNLEKLSLAGNPIRDTSPLRALLSQNPNVQIDIDVSIDEPIDVLIDVLIYTGGVWWITRPAAIVEAKTTERLLQSAGIQAKITDSENTVKQWMLQTSSDGSVDVLILYGPIPTTIYPAGNTAPDGSVAENWIETSDGNTILNHADYLGFWSTNIGQERQQNGANALQNLMDIPSIFIPVDRDNIPMFVTADGSALTPSLRNFQSDRAFPLNQLHGRWFAEKIFASNTGKAEATLADPVIVRNGNRGRIAIVHQTSFEDNPKGEVAAEIIINYLLSEPTKLTEDVNVVHVESLDHPPMYWVNTNNGVLYSLIDAEVENLGPNVRNATSLAIDGGNEKVYWTEKTSNTTGKIRRANLDGTNVQLIKNLTSAPHSIALDTAAGKIYLTNGWGKVQRLNVDGSNFEPNLITGLDSPNGLALDMIEGKVYWTEQMGDASGKIRRANLDGSNIALVKSLTSAPRDLAIDTTHGKLYLTNSRGKVQRLNFDGSNFQPNLITDLDAPKGIAVDMIGGKIYWTEADGISCSNLSGEDIQKVVTGLAMPADIVLARALVNAAVASAPAMPMTPPEETTLLPNYPNPFNPETWIPYRLAKPADVTLTIYAVNGQLIRRLALGHQRAGTYQSRSRAAYWDGKNGVGESVASGLYFFTLSADDFIATGKMSIKK